MYTPTFEDFKKKARQGNLIPVYREILADLETPVSAFLKIAAGENAFLLESVEGGEKWARYCFLGADPSVVLRTKGKTITIERNGKTETRRAEGDPLDALKALMADYRPVPVEGLPRFYGGAVGYLAYDMVRFFERLPEMTVDDLGLPDAQFMITDALLIFDNVAQKIKVVANVHLKDLKDTGHAGLRGAYDGAVARIEELIGRLGRPLSRQGGARRGTSGPPPEERPPEWTSNFKERASFEAAVAEAREKVLAGEVIQVVLAQRLSAPVPVDPFDVYRALRTVNPSPYMFFLKLGGLKLVGSSPEVLVRLEGKQVEVRPIAGTRRRGATEEEDRALERDLLSDEKERAEHIMLVDLGRNDVGRVAERGTVKVNELMVIERYSHVMHIVSNVRGRLAPGKDAYDVLRACFPAGTVSGAPKVRAMEIIEEQEPTRRGPYAGAVGYFSFSGNMDTCIAIRTLVMKDNQAYLGVGAGIVADSVPEREYEETMNKGRALLRAVELAAQGLR
ncbi:MAG: anthranilate synthase component I [Candidatus Tectomicrobia bacterium]|nr:anthranilate synthase component I [Candidatus Tectomicrobia bacterium]